MQIVEYESFSKHSHCRTLSDVSALPDRKRFKFYHCAMQTFAMMRLHPDPRVKDFLNKPIVRQSIAAQARHWITEPRYSGMGDDAMPWFQQLAKLQMPECETFRNTSASTDNQFWYLLENISGGESIMSDITFTLDVLMKSGKLYCPPCNAETDAQAYNRVRRVDNEDRMYWLNNVSAPAIARNAFALGWELRMLSAVRDFAVEVVQRKPRCYLLMNSFLRSIDVNILKLQQKEEDTNVAAAIALQRAGLDTEVCRMIMTGKTRYMGVPLAMMPPYLKLV
jgi:hypothetical protein